VGEEVLSTAVRMYVQKPPYGGFCVGLVYINIYCIMFSEVDMATLRLEIEGGSNELRVSLARHRKFQEWDVRDYGEYEGFPPVIEVSQEEGERILKMVQEFKQLRDHLELLIRRDLSVLGTCQCGNCPT